MHFVDVEREETGGLLALEASCALVEVVLLLEIVGRTSGPASSVERLLAATDKILILGYFHFEFDFSFGIFHFGQMSEKHCWPAAIDKRGLDLIWNYTPHASTACLLFAKGDQLETTTI